jgi:hypothetical protein
MEPNITRIVLRCSFKYSSPPLIKPSFLQWESGLIRGVASLEDSCGLIIGVASLEDRAGRKSQGPAILPSMPVRVSRQTFLFVYFVLHCQSEMQLVCRNDHGQLGIRFCFKWHLFLKHSTVSMVILYSLYFYSLNWLWCICATISCVYIW